MKIGWKEILVLITFSLAYICLLVKFAHAIDPNCFRQMFDGIDYAVAKSTDGKVYVFSEQEKQTTIAEHNKELTDLKFSTNSTAWFWTEADFMPCSATRNADVFLITTTFNVPLRANDWFVPVFQSSGTINLLNGKSVIQSEVIKPNGFYNKLAIQAIPQ